MNTPRNPTGRPTTDTMIDRYVWAVLKSIPEAKRADIDRELRATIADDVDSRVDAGATEAEAERAALLELGDPKRLAAGYAGRPLWLVGPELYLDYVRLLTLLLWIVLPIVGVAMFLINVLSGVPLGGAIGGAIGILISVAVHLCFWTTFVFFMVERTGAATRGVTGNRNSWVPFDPDALSPVPLITGIGRGDLIASLVFLVFVPVAIFWQQFSSVVTQDGVAVPLIDPTLWSFWLPYFLALTVVAAAFAIVLFRVGRWTGVLVAVNALITVAATVPVVWLIATGQLINPEFLDEFGWGRYVAEGSPGAIATAAAIAGISAWSIIDSVVKAYRSRHGLAGELKDGARRLASRL